VKEGRGEKRVGVLAAAAAAARGWRREVECDKEKP
jgi:hypothetical protein